MVALRGLYIRHGSILAVTIPPGNPLDKVDPSGLKQLKTVNSNSPWAYIREGLLSEGYLRLKFGGLTFGRAYYFFFYFFFFGGGGRAEGLLSEFYGNLSKQKSLF